MDRTARSSSLHIIGINIVAFYSFPVVLKPLNQASDLPVTDADRARSYCVQRAEGTRLTQLQKGTRSSSFPGE
jgi:hypothetical protein